MQLITPRKTNLGPFSFQHFFLMTYFKTLTLTGCSKLETEDGRGDPVGHLEVEGLLHEGQDQEPPDRKNRFVLKKLIGGRLILFHIVQKSNHHDGNLIAILRCYPSPLRGLLSLLIERRLSASSSFRLFCAFDDVFKEWDSNCGSWFQGQQLCLLCRPLPFLYPKWQILVFNSSA